MEPNLGVSDVLGQHTDNPPEPRSGDYLPALKQMWQVSPLEQGIKGQIEQWLRKNAVQAIADCDADGFPEEAQAMRATYLNARAAGNYNWQGSAWRAAITDIPGARYLLFLLLRRCHPTMTESLSGQIFKDNPSGSTAAINWALGNEQAPQVGANGQAKTA